MKISSRTLSFALALIAAVALGAASGCATLDEKQREWIFQPSDRSWYGGQQAAEGMQEVWIDFTSAETRQPVKLHGLLSRHPNPKAPVLLYLHGSRWNVVGSAHRMRRWQGLGFHVLGIDYRGFGKSTDALPSETLAAEDAAAAWAWIDREFVHQDRYIFGHSLGGAIAVRLAAETSTERGVIVEGTFSSLRDVIATHAWGWLPVGPLLTQKFEADRDVGRIGSPLIVIHGSSDQVIASTLGRKLFDAAQSPKAWVLVEGGSHHNASAHGRDQVASALSQTFGMPAAR